MTGIILLVLAGILFFLLVALLVAVQAQRRGYSLLVWTLAGMLGNPVLLLVLLGIMPDHARRQRRTWEMNDLDERLASKKKAPVAAPAIQAKLERSLGDQLTNVPDQSLGDEETRM